MKRNKMSPFPGRLRKGKDGYYYLNRWQENWLRRYYPTYLNREIMNAMGICRQTFRRIIRGMFPALKKDHDWLYYYRCKQIHKDGDHGCAVVHKLTRQKRKTITVATKLSWSDYILMNKKAKEAHKTMYEYIQVLLLKELQRL